MNKTYMIIDGSSKAVGFGFTRKAAVKQAESHLMTLNPDTDEFPELTLLVRIGAITIAQKIEL